MKKYLLMVLLTFTPFGNGMIIKDSLCAPDDTSLVQLEDLKNFVKGCETEIAQMTEFNAAELIPKPTINESNFQKAGYLAAKFIKVLTGQFLPIYLKVVIESQLDDENRS